MTLQTELQINIVINNYTQRSGSYSSNYDYLLLDNLASSSYSNLFRSDLKNLKIKTKDGTNCPVLYLPSYGSQPSAILVRVPVGKISQTTKLLLEVYDTSTSFSSTLSTGGEVLMFDANNDTYSQFFMSYSGLSINNDSTDGGRFLRARFVPSLDGSSPTSLFTTFASGGSLSNNRVTVARFKRISGCVDVNDNAIYHGTSTGTYMMQVDYNLTTYQEDIKVTSLNWDGEKSYMLQEVMRKEIINNTISMVVCQTGSAVLQIILKALTGTIQLKFMPTHIMRLKLLRAGFRQINSMNTIMLT